MLKHSEIRVAAKATFSARPVVSCAIRREFAPVQAGPGALARLWRWLTA